MSRVLVTGGSGFVGSAVIDALTHMPDKYEVLYTYRSSQLQGHPEGEGLRIDLTDSGTYQAYRKQLLSVDYLVHAAAIINHGEDDLEAGIDDHINANITALCNLLEYLPNLKKIVFVSSCSASIIQQDTSLYGLGKFLIEELVRRAALERHIVQTTLRFPQIYGMSEPQGTFITKFMHAVRTHEAIRLAGKGAVVRDVIYIKDVVGSITYALGHDTTGLYTVNDPEAHTVAQVLRLLEKSLKTQAKVEEVPMSAHEIVRNSFHFASDVKEFGYEMQYTLAQGIRDLVKETNK